MEILRHSWYLLRRRLSSSRRSQIGALVLVLVAGAAVVAARQVTVALSGGQTVAAADPVGTTGAEVVGPGAEGQGSIGATEPVPADPTPGAGVVLTPVIGEPTIIPYDRDPVPDTVHIEPGPVVGLAASLPVVDPPAAGGGVAGGGGSAGGGDDPFEPPFEIPDVEAAPPPQPFGVGVWVEPVGHYARVTVGVNGGPDGLAALRVDFGDGNTHTLSAGRVDQLRDGGTVTLVHRYEPTLTPQPQQAAVTATDGAGRTRQASTRFDTQAEFKVGFSAMTITALDDCDFIGGKGDFVLYWNLDGREKESHFDLDEGETYVEQEFRTGLDGVRYGEGFVYQWAIAELDSGFERFAKVWDWNWQGPKPPVVTDVMELGTHTYPVSGEFPAFGDEECDVAFAYTYTLAMPDQPPNAR